LIRHQAEPAMPDNQPKLREADIAKIAAWIDLGAPYAEPLVAGKPPARDRSVVTDADRQWWSLQPLAKVVPPKNALHPVDAFLLQAGQPKKLTHPSPPSDRGPAVCR